MPDITFEEALVAYVTDLRPSVPLYPLKVPQSRAVYPCYVLNVLSKPRDHNLTGAAGVAHARVQFSIYSPNYLDCISAAESLRQLLQGFQGYLPPVAGSSLILQGFGGGSIILRGYGDDGSGGSLVILQGLGGNLILRGYGDDGSSANLDNHLILQGLNGGSLIRMGLGSDLPVFSKQVYVGSCLLEDEITSFDEPVDASDTGTYSVSQDYVIWYREVLPTFA